VGRAIVLALAGATLGLFLFLADFHRLNELSQTTPLPMAPDFSLTELDGHTMQLSAYHGKVVLLDFWATWCTPCRTEAPRFVEMQNRYGSQGLQILGISMDDDAEPVRGFEQDLQLNYPIVMGNAAVGESYGGVFGLPVVFLIDRDGRIAAKYRGPVDLVALEHQTNKLLKVE
jgi:peroxiredoxin